MSEYRTFTGKSVDDAMEEACKHFDAKREKLEIEIIEGGSTGIFGLVGKKKAKIKARLREEFNLMSDPAKAAPAPQAAPPAPAASLRAPEAGAKEPGEAASRAPVEAAPKAPAPALGGGERTDDAAPASQGAQAAQSDNGGERRKSGSRDGRQRDRRPQKDRRQENGGGQKKPQPSQAPQNADAARTPAPAPAQSPAPQAAEGDAPAEAPKPPRQPRLRREEGPPAEIPQELKDIVNEVMGRMLEGILGQPAPFTLEGRPDRITVLVDDEDNSGLLIGREGQTLSSLQYLVNRIVARRWESPVRVQINTGEYREKQDENLRRMAIYLADKAKSLGRPQSTKPLSSYHRRVVHLVLQEDESIQTRSKGEGPLKRVLILPRQQKAETQEGQRS